MKLLKKYIHLVLLLCLLIFSFRISYVAPLSSSDLKPIDAFVYSLSAYNLYQHHIYGFKLFGQYYPCKYPYGYPLLIIPFYIIFGSQPYNAIYCTLFFSLLSIVFAYLIGKELGNRFTGLMAALFVALCPLNIIFSKYIMTDTSSVFFTLLICWLLLKVIYLNSKKQMLLLLFLGIVVGFSVSVHITNCLLIPPVIISLLLWRKSNRWSWSMVKKQTLIILGIILALTPLLLYQSHAFGSPLRTGYEVWNPELFGKLESFSFKFFAQPHHNFNRGNFIAYLFALTGLERHFYPVSMIPLILGGGLLILSKRREHNKQMIFLIFLSMYVSLLFVFFSFYYWQHSRFLLRGVSLLMILAACGATFFIDKGLFKSLTKESIFSIIILSFLLMTIIQMSIWSYSEQNLPHPITNNQYRIIKDISRHIPNNAVIISQLDPEISEYYFTEHTEDKIIYITLSSAKFRARMTIPYIKPIIYDRAKKYSFLFRLNGAPNPRTYNFIRRSLKKGIPVYLVYIPHHPVCKKFLPYIKRYFSPIEQKGDKRLFRLYLKDW